jgi:hypothetical protein
MLSPIATPARRTLLRASLKMPNGRFWIEKSQAGSFAASIQLLRDASSVARRSLDAFIVAPG